MASSHQPVNAQVIAKIEAVFENIADSLLDEENPSVPVNDIFIPLRYKKHASNNDTTSSLLDTVPSDDITNVFFPAKGRPKKAWRFTVIVRILDLIHEALCDNVIVSKRNIYYKDSALFKSQLTVDHYVDVIANTLGVSRLALNVTAAAKGLVVGKFILKRVDGTQAYRKSDAPRLIDDPHEIQGIDVSEVTWIVVVEKESTFRTLASGNLHRSPRAGNGIILTAKGYPDLSTRSFLLLLSISHDPDRIPPPIYALTDFDPDGLAIMSSYKHGSFNLSHENAGLNVPRIRWLGVRSRDVLAGNGKDDYDGLLRLSARDRKKATDMLKRSEILQEGGKEQEWRREMQVMLMLNVKAEMEVLAEREGGVNGWVEEKLLDNGTGLHTDGDLLERDQLADMMLGEGDSSSLQASEDTMLDETLETTTSLPADEDLLRRNLPASMTLNTDDSPSLQPNEEVLPDEALEMSNHGESPVSFQGDEDLLELNQLADMTLDEDNSPSPQASEGTMLDETLEISAHRDGPPSLQADDDLLDTHQMVDMLLADEGSPVSETQVDENLLDTHEIADVLLAEGDHPEHQTSEEPIPSFEWDEEL